MTAQQFINEGNLAAALQELQDDVRRDALNAKHRIFLFQLLSELSSDDSLRLARQTVWEGDAALGQRMLTTDNADYALLDIRRIEFDMSDEDG